MEILPWRGCDLSYELKSWFHLPPFLKLMLFQTHGDSPVLVMVPQADLGTPSVSLLSVFIFCCFYKVYMVASANSASRAKPCNFISGKAGGEGDLSSQPCLLETG